MSRPLKKPLHPSRKAKVDWKKLGSRLSKAGETISKLSVAHPAVIGLGIMAGTTLISTAVSVLGTDRHPVGREQKWYPISPRVREEVRTQMSGLYAGAQTVTLAMAVVPMVVSVAGAAAQAAGALTEKAASAATLAAGA